MPLSGVLVEHECPRCHREVELRLGELCRPCRVEIAGRARRIARWVSVGTTLPLALYVMLNLPAEPRFRMVLAAALGVWLIVTRRVTMKVVEEYLK